HMHTHGSAQRQLHIQRHVYAFATRNEKRVRVNYRRRRRQPATGILVRNRHLTGFAAVKHQRPRKGPLFLCLFMTSLSSVTLQYRFLQRRWFNSIARTTIPKKILASPQGALYAADIFKIVTAAKAES